MGVTKEAMEKAVNWWAEKVGGSQPHSNGNDGLASVMACMMADVGRKPVSESQIAVFKEELAKRITEVGERSRIFLSCDYGPCKMLSESAEIAGINVLNFPFKTDMTILDGKKVLVSDGYARPWEEI